MLLMLFMAMVLISFSVVVVITLSLVFTIGMFSITTTPYHLVSIIDFSILDFNVVGTSSLLITLSIITTIMSVFVISLLLSMWILDPLSTINYYSNLVIGKYHDSITLIGRNIHTLSLLVALYIQLDLQVVLYDDIVYGCYMALPIVAAATSTSKPAINVDTVIPDIKSVELFTIKLRGIHF